MEIVHPLAEDIYAEGVVQEGDGHANQGSGHLQPGFRPEPKIVYLWGHRPAGGRILESSQQQSGQNPALEADLRPESIVA